MSNLLKLKFVFDGDVSKSKVFNAETGEEINNIYSVSLSMGAHDRYPRVAIEIGIEHVQIEGVGTFEKKVTMESLDVPTLVNKD